MKTINKILLIILGLLFAGCASGTKQEGVYSYYLLRGEDKEAGVTCWSFSTSGGIFCMKE